VIQRLANKMEEGREATPKLLRNPRRAATPIIANAESKRGRFM
jgi:hypothetical protein